jgi:predicted phage-related endonuclease
LKRQTPSDSSIPSVPPLSEIQDGIKRVERQLELQLKNQQMQIIERITHIVERVITILEDRLKKSEDHFVNIINNKCGLTKYSY